MLARPTLELDAEFEATVNTALGTVWSTARWASMPRTPARPRPAKRRKGKSSPQPGEFLLEFGRHIGKRLKQAPRGYVIWLAETDFGNGYSPAKEAQTYARAYLGWSANTIDAEHRNLVRGL